MAALQYNPLDRVGNSIRLLRLLKGKPDDEIVCELFSSYSGQKMGPAYNALSYTWGYDTAHTNRINVDGQDFHATENLYSAMKHIRRPIEDVILWVDAICINQADDQEKGHQVRQMTHIYAGADEVLIWLGHSNGYIDQLMELAVWVDAKAIEVERQSGEDWLTLCRRFMSELIHLLDTDSFAIYRRGLAELLEKPWFNRVWIIQEAANARIAQVLCGSSSCPARIFALMPSLMYLEVRESTQAVLDIMPRIRTKSWWSSKRDLHSLLVKFADSLATIPADKIYALLGISEDASDPATFYPCYHKSIDAVLRDTASFILFGEVLDDSYYFPPFELPELTLSVPQIAAKTLKWALHLAGDVSESPGHTDEENPAVLSFDVTGSPGQTDEENLAVLSLKGGDPRFSVRVRASPHLGGARRTAMLLVHLLNEGELDAPKLLRSLAIQLGKDPEVDEVLQHGDVKVNILFGEKTNSLIINPKNPIHSPAILSFKIFRERDISSWSTGCVTCTHTRNCLAKRKGPAELELLQRRRQLAERTMLSEHPPKVPVESQNAQVPKKSRPLVQLLSKWRGLKLLKGRNPASPSDAN